jgi:adenosylcobinamide-phosphate synthase
MTAVAAGLLADQLLGEPPTRWHPTARFGSAMEALERRSYAPTRLAGLAYTATGVALGWLAGRLLRRLVGRWLSTAVATAAAVAGRMLDREATRVGEHLERGDLDGARRAVRALVGRRAEQLDTAGLARAVIESVAENTVDAVTAPVCWALAGGAPAVLVHRAVNTMDAMVGHRNERYARFGWASARLDDALNWLPARLTAYAVLAGTAGGRAGRVALMRRQAAAHPSPNGGLIEAAFALRLGVTVGGTNRYGTAQEDRGRLGRGPAASAGDIARAVALRRRISLGAAAACLAVAGLRRTGRAISPGQGRVR